DPDHSQQRSYLFLSARKASRALACRVGGVWEEWSMSTVVAGVGIVILAAVLGGMTGFGYNLIATPLLMLLGVHPATAVAVSVAIALARRVAVMYRLWASIRWRRALPLAVGGFPGLVAGALIGGVVDPLGIRIVT